MSADTIPDTLRAVLDSVFRSSEYDWRQTSGLFVWLRNMWERIVLGLTGLQESHPVGYYLVMAALTGILLAIFAHFGYILWRILRPARSRFTDTLEPAVPTRDATWYLRESSRLQREGRYVEAIALRFLALTLALDRKSAVRFHPSKTPAEYAGEARLDGVGRDQLRQLVEQLYGHLFGGVPCTDKDLSQFDELASGLDGHVAPT